MNDVVSSKFVEDEDKPLGNTVKIIIKKGDIGLEEYQHQNYQYNLFNNRNKHDDYYNDLNKIKERFDKTIPNMQHVIQMDMKRMNTNKLYERQLKHAVHGPRGLDWQYKQQLKRFKSDERNIQRDLLRLNYDLARISLCSCLHETQPSNFSRKTKLILKRSLLMTNKRISIDFSTSTKQISPSSSSSSINKQINHNPLYLHEQQILQEKLKDFLS
ncbi:hypothetical protein I4U23_027917 [Adineta vaga]|nr:hypothetical protein I4U23_027917 [Adineta vaga]